MSSSKALIIIFLGFFCMYLVLEGLNSMCQSYVAKIDDKYCGVRNSFMASVPKTPFYCDASYDKTKAEVGKYNKEHRIFKMLLNDLQNTHL